MKHSILLYRIELNIIRAALKIVINQPKHRGDRLTQLETRILDNLESIKGGHRVSFTTPELECIAGALVTMAEAGYENGPASTFVVDTPTEGGTFYLKPERVDEKFEQLCATISAHLGKRFW